MDATRAINTVKVAALGTGPGLVKMLEVNRCVMPRAVSAGIRLEGVVSASVSDEHRTILDSEEIPLYPEISALLKETPDVTLFVNLDETGDPPELPAGASLIGAREGFALFSTMADVCCVSTVELGKPRAREFLAAVLDGLEEDILLLDTHGTVVDCNRTVYSRKHTQKPDVIGRSCHDLEGGDFCQRKRKNCPFNKTLATGEKSEAVHTQVDSNGRVSYFRVYTYPLFNKAGDVTHVVEIRRDITVRTYAEKRIQQERKMAAIGELSAYIAHEIRNPLISIGGFARSLVRSETLEEGERTKAKIIYEESKRLDGILASILTYSKPSDVRVDEVDLNVVAGETVQLMGFGCGKKNIDIRTRLQPSLPYGQGVPELIKQCLVNMVKNAIEAVNGGGIITVSTGMQGSRVFVRVEDNGHGMADDVRIRVFTPFYSTKEEGTGLGLSMTKRIVEEAGGKIEITSRVGEGTAVTILLEPATTILADSLQGLE